MCHRQRGAQVWLRLSESRGLGSATATDSFPPLLFRPSCIPASYESSARLGPSSSSAAVGKEQLALNLGLFVVQVMCMRTYGGTISTDGGNSMQQRVSLVGHFKSRGTMEKDILFSG